MDEIYAGHTLEELKQVCEKFNIPLVVHDKNYGIPKAWNTLTNYYDSDFMVLLNDDIQISDSNWLKCMIYFLENNENVGAAGWPLFHMKADGTSDSKPDYNGNPALVGAPVGCAFAFRKSSYDLVPNGFPEILPSFYEEIWFGFELAKIKYPSYMIPFPAVEHWGSQTFAKNPELSIAKPNPEVLSFEKYREIMSKKYPMSRIEPVPGYVYRMDYSRVIFALHFGVDDYWESPQQAVHERYVYSLQGREGKWLDKDLKEKQGKI